MRPSTLLSITALLLIIQSRVDGVALSSLVDAEAADADRFLARGHHILAQASSPGARFNVENDGSIIYRDATECKVYCNGKLFRSTQCIGRTEVQCLTMTVPENEGEKEQVELYTRVCEGHFINETTQHEAEFDTSQACRGLSMLTMRREHKQPENDQWVTDYSWKKNCATRFIMQVITRVDPTGEAPDETQVVTLCVGSGTTFINSLAASEPSVESTKPSHSLKAKVHCNGHKSKWTRHCDGVFEATDQAGDVQTDTICDGKWTPYNGVSWECEGDYNFTRTETRPDGYRILERGCTGSVLISSADSQVVYHLCNGESKFNEIYTVPVKQHT